MDASTDHRFQPLNEGWFRLLHLEPHENTEAPISCSLISCPILADTPGTRRYGAPSYTWGSSRKEKTIILDNNALSVTENLHTALVYLRDPFDARTLWVDAVCIDQADLEERRQQVQAMAAIYNTASRVVMWLGEEDESSKQPGCLRRIWAYEISFFVPNPELWLICPELPLILP